MDAVVRGPTAQSAHPDRRAADPAGLALTPVDAVVELEVARRATAVDIVPKRSAALGDRLAQRIADGGSQPAQPVARDATGGAIRPDPGPEQRLVRIDVADADHHVTVHQHELDRATTPARCSMEIVGVELPAERFCAESGEQ